jgi:hypothetical protein
LRKCDALDRSRNFRRTTFVLPNDVLALALDGEKVAA